MGLCASQSDHSVSDISDDDLNDALLSKLSIKRSNNIEAFLKLAYQYGNQIDALRGILTNETARLKLLEFLKEEYYYGAPEYYEEAQEFLEYETDIIVNQSISQRLNIKSQVANKPTGNLQQVYPLNANTQSNSGNNLNDNTAAANNNDSNKNSTTNRQQMAVSVKKRSQTDQEHVRAGWSEEQRIRYKEVILEIATVAFKRFLKSKMYTNFRSYEKGALSSLRARTSIYSSKTSMNIFSSKNKLNNNNSSGKLPYTRSGHTEATSQFSVNTARNAQQNGMTNEDSAQNLFTIAKKEPGTNQVHFETVTGDQPQQQQQSTANKSNKSNKSTRSNFSLFHSNKSMGQSASRHASGKHAAPRLGSMGSASNARLKSFTERAFQQVAVSADERVLLCSSTWLALLVSGIESCPIGFCIIGSGRNGLNNMKHSHAGGSSHNMHAAHNNSHNNLHSAFHNEPKIAAVNSMFECIFGRDRKDLVGASYRILTTDPFSHPVNNHHNNHMLNPQTLQQHNDIMSSNINSADINMADPHNNNHNAPHTIMQMHSRERNLQDFHNAVANGESLITDIVGVRSNLRHLHCLVALQPVYDQKNEYRFMIVLCLAVRNQQQQLQQPQQPQQPQQQVDTSIQAPGPTPAAGCEADIDLIRTANEHYLRELIDLLPSQFIDENLDEETNNNITTLNNNNVNSGNNSNSNSRNNTPRAHSHSSSSNLGGSVLFGSVAGSHNNANGHGHLGGDAGADFECVPELPEEGDSVHSKTE